MKKKKRKRKNEIEEKQWSHWDLLPFWRNFGIKRSNEAVAGRGSGIKGNLR